MGNTYKLLTCLLQILKMMTESGAEIYRVEESANKMLASYNVKNVDVFATTENIILSLETDDGVIKTHTKRIGSISTDIERIDRLNSLVREISAENIDPDSIEKKIKEIEHTPKYSNTLNTFFTVS